MNIPILKELERLKVAHATAKVKSSAFQPDEKDQKELIYLNALKKEENKRRIEQKLKEADAKVKDLEMKKLETATIQLEPLEVKPQERPHTAPANIITTKSRAKSFKFSLQDEMSRPQTALIGNFHDRKSPFDVVLKSSTASFGNELKQQVEEQAKDSRRIFDALLHHFKGGGVGCQFSAKRQFEVIDINNILASRSSSHMRSTVKLEDISNMKKKDGIALFFDPTTDTGATTITVRIYFQKAIDLVTEESCSRDYKFHSDGNYFGLELSDESSCVSSNRNTGGDRSPNQHSPSESPSGSPMQTTRKSVGDAAASFNSVMWSQLSRADTNPLRSGSSRRSLPGWQGRPPIFIPSTRCSLEILQVEGAPAADASTAYNLSKLRIFAVAAQNSRSAVKKLQEFCGEYFVSHTANLVVAGGISALNLAALHGNLEVSFFLFACS